MPTILIISGIRFFFYSNEETRMHIHVEYGGREAKIWLDNFEVAYNHGFKLHDMNKVLKLVRNYEKALKKAWIAHFG